MFWNGQSHLYVLYFIFNSVNEMSDELRTSFQISKDPHMKQDIMSLIVKINCVFMMKINYSAH